MSWIKIETTLISKPEVMHLTILLGCSEFEVVGHLVAFWSWVDANMSPECPEVIGTKSGLDRVCGRTGMVDALIEVGWLKHNGNLFSVPNIDRHLSKSAKQRAVETRRKAESRKKAIESGVLSDSCPKSDGTKTDVLFSSLLSSSLTEVFGEIHLPESLNAEELNELARWARSMSDEPTFFPGSPSLAEKILQASRYKNQGHNILDLLSAAIAGGYKQLYPGKSASKASEETTDPQDHPAWKAILKISREHGSDLTDDVEWRIKNVTRRQKDAKKGLFGWDELARMHPIDKARAAKEYVQRYEEIGDG